MSKLKPCPFCGSKSKLNPDHYYWVASLYFAQCADSKCGTLGPIRDTERKAVMAWNKRAEETAK